MLHAQRKKRLYNRGRPLSSETVPPLSCDSISYIYFTAIEIKYISNLAVRARYLRALHCQHRNFPVQVKPHFLPVSSYFGPPRNKDKVAMGSNQEMIPASSPEEGRETFPRFSEKTPITVLLERNRAWADRQKRENPLLFPSLAHSQHPHILWIGCSDSRVPETTVLDLLPGDLFVHRNIGNVVSAGDMSVLSVVQFAVEVLGVNHIVVCGMNTIGWLGLQQDIMDVEDVLLR